MNETLKKGDKVYHTILDLNLEVSKDEEPNSKTILTFLESGNREIELKAKREYLKKIS